MTTIRLHHIEVERGATPLVLRGIDQPDLRGDPDLPQVARIGEYQPLLSWVAQIISKVKGRPSPCWS